MITTDRRMDALTLVDLKERIADVSDQLDVLKGQYERHRDKMLVDWDDSKKFVETETATITKRVTDDVKIIDPAHAVTWLKRNRLDANDFMKLDTVKAKPVFKSAIYTQKKRVTGVEKTHSETLVITFKP
jgi:hypothetical protein